MAWLAEALLLLLVVAVALWGRQAMKVKRDFRDKAQVLRSLNGRRVTVLAGLDNVMSHTGVLTVPDDASSERGRSNIIVLRDGAQERAIMITEVHSVRDAVDGSPLGGPW